MIRIGFGWKGFLNGFLKGSCKGFGFSALIRIRFGGRLHYNYFQDPPLADNSVGNYLGPYISIRETP